MTFEQWLTKAQATCPDEQRWGQWLWNSLGSIRPDLTDTLILTEFDPFHLDIRVPAFLTEVARRW